MIKKTKLFLYSMKLINRKFKSSILNFTPISTESGQKLVGGFSQSISVGPTTTLDDGASNNCMGGNCTNGCGVGGQNSGCNAVSSCGGSGLPNLTYGCNNR